MSNRGPIFHVSTFLLVLIATSTSIGKEILDSDDKRLCNNAVAAWVRAQVLETKNWMLDEFLKTLKDLLDKPAKTSITDRSTVAALKFVRDLKARRGVDPAFNLAKAIKSAKRLTTIGVRRRVDQSMVQRIKIITQEFARVLEKFVASLSSEERKNYKELFSLRDQIVNTSYVFRRFGYLDDLDKRCSKCC